MADQREPETKAASDAHIPVWRRPRLLPFFAIAISAELGYAILNVSAMPPYLRYDMHLGESAIAAVITVFFLSEAVFKSGMGRMGDRHGRRNLLVLAPLISVLTAFATIFMRPSWGAFVFIGFVVLRAMDGVGAAIIWPNTFAAVGDAVKDDERAEAISILNMCYWVGIALGPFLDSQFWGVFGFRAASFYLVAALFGTATVLAWRFAPHDRPSEHHLAAVDEHHVLHFSALAKVAREIPGHIMLAITMFIGLGLPSTIFKLYALDSLHLTDAQFGYLLLPAALVMAALSLPAGRMVDRIGRATSVRLGLGVGAAGIWIVTVYRSELLLVVIACLVGVGFLVAIPAWLAEVSDIDERRRGTYLGAVQTAQGVGALLGAPTGGFLYEHASKSAPFIGTAIALTISFGLSYVVFGRKRERTVTNASS